MKKIAIIGCPGAGKSYFARELAQKHNLPIYPLDMLYHDKKRKYARDRDAWLAAVGRLVEKPRWIIDGNYKSTFELRLPAADTIIYLDYPTYLCLWRALKRRVQYRGDRLQPGMPSGWTEKMPWDFFTYIVSFRRNDRPHLYRELEQYKATTNVIILRNPQAAREYLKTT